jgi:osmotically-inducible protein OsmY
VAARARKGGRKGSRRDGGTFIVDHTSEDLIASQLLDELDFRHGIDVATLDVRIRDGVAVARGSVSDLDELEAVKDTVQDAGGITDLTFVVQVAPDRRESDRDRARMIQEVLDAEADLASDNIVVACVGRKAVVRGTVRTQMRKLKAGLIALRCSDAARVANRLVVLSDI